MSFWPGASPTRTRESRSFIRKLMVDVVDPATRSRMMSGIQGKNTKPEMTVRRTLFAAGFRFRQHRRDLPGAPDIVMPGRNIAIFVHGCFWHRHTGCRYSKLPATRPEFWKDKLERNAERDRRAAEGLLLMGWRVLIVWECAIRDKLTLASLPEELVTWVVSDSSLGEISMNNYKNSVSTNG
jgi:DNA mismatch endonuclease (patch repair protein)